MKDYPFVKCLKPKRIINPYTRESLIVECGSCPACSLRKSSLNAMKVKLENLSHKYAMFVTLTYNNVSLPRMLHLATNRYKDECGEVCDTYCQDTLVDITQRLGTEGTLLGSSSSWYFLRTALAKKVNLPSGVLPHLSKYDAQLFIKRLRKNLDTYFLKKYGTKAPKIRFYLVGEYGPIHFRPHYHVILWFEDDEVYKIIRQIIHKSWSFGRIHCEKSLNKCGDYVAKYVNSSVSLPDVFKIPSVRPFSIHSTHLGEKVLEVPRQEIYENEFKSVIKRSIPHYATDSDVILWRSLKAYYFPKCKGYSEKSEYERLYAYTTYEKASAIFGTDVISEQATFLTELLLRRFYKHNIYSTSPSLEKLLDYFERSTLFDPWSFERKGFSQHMTDVCRRIYCELRLSKHFIYNVCLNNPSLYKPMYDKIVNFWLDNDLYNLNNQLKHMEDYSVSEWFEDEKEFSYFYHNSAFDFEQYKKSKIFRGFETDTKTNSRNAVKHKKLNDLNKIFENK